MMVYMPLKQGSIYSVTDLIKGKVVYVGQTTASLKSRISQHKFSDSILGKSLRKYGIARFQFCIIKTTTYESLDTWESYFIGKFNTLHPNGMNLCLPIGTGRLSEYSKTKIRKSHSKHKIFAINSNGDIKEFLSNRHAALELGINTGHVWQAVNGERYSAGGYAFWREGEPPKTKEDVVLRKSLNIVAISSSGEELHFNSARACGKMLGVDPSSVIRIAKGIKGKSLKGYTFKIIKIGEKDD